VKIRSITYFLEPGNPLDEARIADAGRFLAQAATIFRDGGLEVETTRLALPPFEKTFNAETINNAVQFAQTLEAECFVQSIDAASLGVARPSDPERFYDIIPDVIGATETIFAAAIIASPLSGINLQAIQRTARIINRCSTLALDGSGNLRFAALANVEPGSALFPAAYHEGGVPAFAIATEAADLAVTAFTGSTSLLEAHTRLVTSLESQAKTITQLARKASGRRGVKFNGIDFSLAPFPNAENSIGAALEALGLPAVGGSGTVAAAAFLTDAIHKANFIHTGFSGLLLPILEDTVLAQRAAEGLLTLNDLLLYSTVCGTGLDTVPLPGATSAAELAAILLDVAALALRQHKPLTARLLPIPDKQAGDEVGFDSSYFVKGRVLATQPKTRPLSGALGGDEAFDIARLR
jgi:hypothetical protein